MNAKFSQWKSRNDFYFFAVNFFASHSFDGKKFEMKMVEIFDL